MPPPSQRRWEIDALRGLMLVLMTLTHLPSRLTSPLGQPFGYVSAAEGFVLLSGFMAGMVYGKLAVQRGIGPMRQAFFRRALLVYGCHVAMLAFLFTVIAFVGVKVDQPAVKDLLSFYLQRPGAGLLGGLLLLYEPPLLDILPMYILFMLLSPWAFSLALTRGWMPVLAGSLALWLGAQFGLSELVYGLFQRGLQLPVPYEQNGAFNGFAWQLLWVMGLWMGASRHASAPPSFAFPRWAVVLAVLLGAIGFTWRHAIGQAPFPASPALNLLFDKWQVGPLRLLNLLVLMVLAIRFGPWLAQRLPRIRALEILGAASLPAFCAHLVAVLVVLGTMGNRLDRPWTTDLPLVAGALGFMVLVAWLSTRLDRPPGAPRRAASAVSATGAG
ncbi:MAG TPA: OpgC domain-containing protein [Ramlibacter sp.]|jgi:hypothetical protein|uniref:OpgC domain-containing protein n=1 Tax=Ramlibacter sp. TaxID=1917967 RepID=UPI002D2CA0D6|nr:OpgC domain-containing protein [Ramlibacter sp.]HZY20295.1 OpgC domain-containing protein [Ramlibacter sp.]